MADKRRKSILCDIASHFYLWRLDSTFIDELRSIEESNNGNDKLSLSQTTWNSLKHFFSHYRVYCATDTVFTSTRSDTYAFVAEHQNATSRTSDFELVSEHHTTHRVRTVRTISSRTTRSNLSTIFSTVFTVKNMYELFCEAAVNEKFGFKCFVVIVSSKKRASSDIFDELCILSPVRFGSSTTFSNDLSIVSAHSSHEDFSSDARVEDVCAEDLLEYRRCGCSAESEECASIKRARRVTTAM